MAVSTASWFTVSLQAGQLISEAEVLLKTGLEVAIRREMVEAFDNLW